MRGFRETIGLALRRPLDRLQLPGTRIVVERLLGGADGSIEAKLSTGVRMRLDLADRVQRLEAFRAYERRELALVRAQLRPGDTVLDVGAHVGYYALHAAYAVGPTGQVHAFEPVPANAARLRANVELNEFANVVVNEVAVSAASSREWLGIVDIRGESGWSSLLVAGRENSRDVEVETVTLDGYARDAEMIDAALIKIDVQGKEMDVLLGGRELLSGAGPDVLCEADPYWLGEAGRTPEELIAFMRDLGYRAWGVPARGHPVPISRDELPSLNVYFTKRKGLARC